MITVATTLGGIMRWDLRHPEAPFGDRFVITVSGEPAEGGPLSSGNIQIHKP